MSSTAFGRGGTPPCISRTDRPTRRRWPSRCSPTTIATPPTWSGCDREFGFARQLDHPHIVKVYERGPRWLAMEYVDGGNAGRLATLDQRLDRAGPDRRRA